MSSHLLYLLTKPQKIEKNKVLSKAETIQRERGFVRMEIIRTNPLFEFL